METETGFGSDEYFESPAEQPSADGPFAGQTPAGEPPTAQIPTEEPSAGQRPAEELRSDLVLDEAVEIDTVDALLNEVDHALARLDDGSYGRCEQCGTIIADDRLQQLPTARTCATCLVPVVG